ncbi:MAG: hypothetical protein AAF705_21595, partial [Bacteroidota bacterium]
GILAGFAGRKSDLSAKFVFHQMISTLAFALRKLSTKMKPRFPLPIPSFRGSLGGAAPMV